MFSSGQLVRDNHYHNITSVFKIGGGQTWFIGEQNTSSPLEKILLAAGTYINAYHKLRLARAANRCEVAVLSSDVGHFWNT